MKNPFSGFKFWGLFNKEILGNNKRIRSYILARNARKHYPSVDNKVITSDLCKAHGLPVPETYMVIHTNGQIKPFIPKLKHYSSFVIKPAKGAMGNGILIVNDVQWNEQDIRKSYFNTNRGMMDYSSFTYYVGGILSGMYSLTGNSDSAIVQRKLDLHPNFKDIVSSGIPDVRIILFDGFPILAMTRLPTIASGGRGNLHQGAVGCGIDMKTGLITHAVQFNLPVTHHPDTGVELNSFVIPQWKEVLELGARCAEIVRLGYIGVDIVVDSIEGPLLLEMNARPGLSIQLANRKGLNSLLKKAVNAPKQLTWQEKILWSHNNLF